VTLPPSICPLTPPFVFMAHTRRGLSPKELQKKTSFKRGVCFGRMARAGKPPPLNDHDRGDERPFGGAAGESPVAPVAALGRQAELTKC
jgi:hypothetical protein